MNERESQIRPGERVVLLKQNGGPEKREEESTSVRDSL